MFNTIWFCLVLSTSHFTFFCFLSQLISSLRYKMCFSLSWFNVNRGLKWQVLVQDILLSPPRSSSNIFLSLRESGRGFKRAAGGFLSTNWGVLGFLSLAASREHILRMSSGVAKVNPGSPSVSSNQVCKSLQKHLSPCGPRVVVGNLSHKIGTTKAKNATHRTQTGSASASGSSNKTNWIPRVWKVMDLFCF